MAKEIFMDTNNLSLLAFSIENKIEEIDEVYKEVKNKLNSIDGTNNLWKGKGATAFVNLYQSVVKDFSPTIEELEKYNLFLASTIENYEKIENSLNEDIEKNSENLKID